MSPTSPIAAAPAGSVSLDQLVCGRAATLARADVDGDLQARLCALGLVPGKVVRVLRRAAFGDTLHLRVGSTEFMIRRREATHIWVHEGLMARDAAPLT